MKRICMYLSAAALLVCFGIASAQTCPEFVRKVNITQYLDSGATLPVTGTVVAGSSNGGIYKSVLGKNTPTLITNTTGDRSSSTDITEDGQWVLYNSGGIKIIRIDGQFKTTVTATNPSTSDGSCNFWWNAPSGKLEIVYRENGDKIIHAVPVTLSANAAPTFGADHIICQFAQMCEYSMGCARNHFIARVDVASAVVNFGPVMVTLPSNGTPATEANEWRPAAGAIPQMGCMTTISHNGAIACFNSGYDQWCGCLANEACLLRHKSFVLIPFQEMTAPAVAWTNTVLKTMATSINWGPKKYLFLSSKDSTKGISDKSSNFWSDFKNWRYTNDSTYIVGDLDCLAWGNCAVNPDSCAGSRMPDSGTIWLAHYPSNTWTMVLRLPGGVRLNHPAVSICKSPDGTNCPVGTITPLHGNRPEYRANQSQGIYVVDVRGRRIASIAVAAPKLTPGVYYSVDRAGFMKRIVVGR